jgi:hypothetical protein
MADVDPVIREASLSDAKELAALMGEFGYETTGAEMMARLQSILKDGRYRSFVAVIGDRICGVIGTISFPSYEHNDLSGESLRWSFPNECEGRVLAPG